jgi:nucleoside diphosphate kinase
MAAFAQEAEGFYAVHKERPFFKDLVELHDLRPGDGPGAGR